MLNNVSAMLSMRDDVVIFDLSSFDFDRSAPYHCILQQLCHCDWLDLTSSHPGLISFA